MTEGNAVETAADLRRATPDTPAGSAPEFARPAAKREATSRSWQALAPFIVGLAFFALLAAFNHARGIDLWRNYAASGVVLGAPVTWALWYYDVRVPAYIQSIIVIALLLHYGGGSLASVDPYHMGLLGMHGINGAYHHFEWWDHLTHFAGIGAGAMAIAYLLDRYQARRGLAWPAAFIFIVAVCAGLAAGVGVELYEYLGKSAFQTIDQGGYANTMNDLKFNLYGCIVGAALAVALDRRRFTARIRAHWDVPSWTLSGRPWSERVPTGMVGFIAFVFVPAMGSLALSANFSIQGPPLDDAAHYDPALQILLYCAIAGILSAPLAAAVSRRLRRNPRQVPA